MFDGLFYELPQFHELVRIRRPWALLLLTGWGVPLFGALARSRSDRARSRGSIGVQERRIPMCLKLS